MPNPVLSVQDSTTGLISAVKGTNNAVRVRTVATDITDPHDVIDGDSVTLTASASDELTISNMEGYKTIIFTVSGLTTDTLAVKLGYDANVPPTLVSAEVACHSLAQTNSTTDVLLSSGSNGTYILRDLACNSVYFDRTGGTDTPVITYKRRKS